MFAKLLEAIEAYSPRAAAFIEAIGTDPKVTAAAVILTAAIVMFFQVHELKYWDHLPRRRKFCYTVLLVGTIILVLGCLLNQIGWWEIQMLNKKPLVSGI